MAPSRQASLAWALTRLPSAEFAVGFADAADRVVTVQRDGALVATATLVPLANTLSGAPLTAAVVADDERAARSLARRVGTEVDALPAIEVLGPGAGPAVVARQLASERGGDVSVIMEQRLWACDGASVVREIPGVRGAAQPLCPDDHDLVAAWLDEFSVEALDLPPRGVDEWRAELREAAGMRLWVVDDEPVSMANGRRSTPVSARIGPVYTPPAHRGHGYAAAVTAAVAQEWFDRGVQRVVLLTDVANPTSNRLYARIGFVEVDDHTSLVVRFR